MFRADTVIMIPTKREPPILTLRSYSRGDYPVIIVADPEVWRSHRQRYGKRDGFTVMKGAPGLAAQISRCYEVAHAHGYDWWFRVDDDLAEKTFVHRDKNRYCSLVYALEKARRCIDRTHTTLAGFMNGSNRYWMHAGYARTYGLIHGGAQIVMSTNKPAQFIDASLRRYEDVYRSCSHRAMNGAVGRVQFIGVDKSKSSNSKTNQSSIQLDPKQLEREKKIVLKRWPDFVTCNGTRQIHGGKVAIANWRMRRHEGYSP